MKSDKTFMDIDHKLKYCEQQIGYEFNDKSLLRNALTHASGASHRLTSNERLEFLGDAILGSIVCEMLYVQFTTLLEGDLTKIKSVVVSRLTCAKISSSLDLEKCLIVGKGMASNRAMPPSLLADVFESLVAAIYLDGGDSKTRDFVERFMQPEINLASKGDVDDNYKSSLQQLAQRDFSMTPTYELIQEKGPDHDKHFKVVARIGADHFAPAWGRNKKEAEQRAASNALATLEERQPPFDADPS